MNIKTTTTILAVVSLGISAAQAVTVVWDGGGGGGDLSWQTGTNWDTDIVPASADDITIGNGEAVTYTPGGDLTIDGGSLAISGGSSWSQTAGNWSRLNNGSMTLNNGTFTRAGGNLVMGFDSDNTFSTSLTNSAINLGGELWFGHNATDRTNQVISLTLNSSSIDANGSVGIWLWNTDASGNTFTIDVNGAGSSIEGRVGRRNSEGSNNSVTWETLWDEGILQTNGGNSGVFSDHFATSGTAGTVEYTLTVVPEPSSAALLGLGGLALILRRRK